MGQSVGGGTVPTCTFREGEGQSLNPGGGVHGSVDESMGGTSFKETERKGQSMKGGEGGGVKLQCRQWRPLVSR